MSLDRSCSCAFSLCIGTANDKQQFCLARVQATAINSLLACDAPVPSDLAVSRRFFNVYRRCQSD